MNIESILFYGYDKKTYFDCIDLINWVNRRHMRIINSWFLVVNLMYLIFSWQNLFGVNDTQIPFYAGFVSVSAALELLLFFKEEIIKKISMQLVHVMVIILMAYAIVASVNQPYMAATMFQVLSVLCALSFISSMISIGGAGLLFGGLFLWASYTYKPMVIVYQDIYNTVVFLSLALILHYHFQRARIEQFITYKENIEIQHELTVQSDFDNLTDLLARGAFFKIADSLMPESENELLVLCLLDLDGFKGINDTYGHQIGDRAIQEAAAAIQRTLEIDHGEKWSYTNRAAGEKKSFAGRLGGDEFICMIRGENTLDDVRSLAEKLLSNLNDVSFEKIDTLKASIGLTVITIEDRNFDGPYHRADDALYESKRNGKNRITFNNKYKRWRES